MSNEEFNEMVKDFKWNRMYSLAKEYYNKYGDLNIPVTFMTGNGIRLGRWLYNMDMAHRGKGNEVITEKQVKMLEEIGMVWKSKVIPTWDGYYELAKEYYHANGHLDIPASYITSTGVKLGRWIFKMRYAYSKNNFKELTEDRIKRLEEIGMIFDRRTADFRL